MTPFISTFLFISFAWMCRRGCSDVPDHLKYGAKVGAYLDLCIIRNLCIRAFLCTPRHFDDRISSPNAFGCSVGVLSLKLFSRLGILASPHFDCIFFFFVFFFFFFFFCFVIIFISFFFFLICQCFLFSFYPFSVYVFLCYSSMLILLFRICAFLSRGDQTPTVSPKGDSLVPETMIRRGSSL